MSAVSSLGTPCRGLLFICSAPAGTGKTTLVQMLLTEFPDRIVQSISYTTRPPRCGEINGVHYHFVSTEEFEELISQDEFLEYIQLYGYYYGTSRQWISKKQAEGKHVILVIDTQGALQIKGKIKATFIFLLPPSIEDLRIRLNKRNTETKDSLEQRLAWAEKEIDVARYYDYCLINDDLLHAYQILRSIMIAEEYHVQKKEN